MEICFRTLDDDDDDDDDHNDDGLEVVELLGRVTSYLIPASLTNATVSSYSTALYCNTMHYNAVVKELLLLPRMQYFNTVPKCTAFTKMHISALTQ